MNSRIKFTRVGGKNRKEGSRAMIFCSHMYIFHPPWFGGIRFGVEAEYVNGFVRQACLRPSIVGGFCPFHGFLSPLHQIGETATEWS